MERVNLIALALIQIALFGFSMALASIFLMKGSYSLTTYFNLTLAFCIMFILTIRYDWCLMGALFRSIIKKNKIPDKLDYQFIEDNFVTTEKELETFK